MSLKGTVYTAVRATVLSHGLRLLLQIFQIAVLARILSPSDFGLMAVAGSFLAVLTLLANFGLSRSLIHFREISDEVRASAYWLNLIAATGMAVLLAAASPVVAMVYGESSLKPVLMLSGLVFPLAAIGQQFLALAEKELQFSSLAVIEVIAALAGFTMSIVLALEGFGVFSMVGGVLTTAGAGSVLAWTLLSDGWRPAWRLRIAEVKHMVKFGIFLIGEGVAGTLHREADILLGGLVAGSGALGSYALARNLALKVATTVINPVLTRVGFPLMAQLQHDTVQLRAIFLSMLRMICSVNFPVYIVLGLFASDIVTLLYGSGWEQSSRYLEMLAIWGGIRSIGNPIGSLIVAVGQARLAFLWNMVLLVVTPLLLLAGARLYGLDGLVWSMVILQLLIVVPMWRWIVRPLCGAGLTDYLRQPALPFAVTLIAGTIAALLARPFEHALSHLGVGLLVFCTCYLLLSYYFNRSWYNALCALLTPGSGKMNDSANPLRP